MFFKRAAKTLPTWLRRTCIGASLSHSEYEGNASRNRAKSMKIKGNACQKCTEKAPGFLVSQILICIITSPIEPSAQKKFPEL